jgi:diadenylate cyclase
MDLGFSAFSSILNSLGLSNLIPSPASEIDYWKTVLQLLLLFAFAAWVYYRILGTYVSRIIKGLIIVFVIYLLSRLLELNLLSQLLGAVLQISVIGFIIIFQPELRRLLEYLGQRDRLLRRVFAASPTNRNKEIVDALISASKTLSASRTGALIVLETENELDKALLKTGTKIYSDISAELLLTIFFPKTALHDGAVVIDSDGRIAAAGVVLPLTNSKLAWEFGTRHRAALGINERTGNPCLIVSEETGKISLIHDEKIDYMETVPILRENLEHIYRVGQKDSRRSNHRFTDFLSTDISELFKGWQFTRKRS